MDTYSEILEAKAATVTSPDGNITVELVGGRISHVDLASGAYSRYSEPDLEEQIVALIKLIIVARRRARREALAETPVIEVVDREPSARDREYRKQLKEIVGEAHSEHLSVYACPGEFWDVEIRQGALSRIRGAEFISECLSTASTAMSNMQRQMRYASNKIYGQITV